MSPPPLESLRLDHPFVSGPSARAHVTFVPWEGGSIALGSGGPLHMAASAKEVAQRYFSGLSQLRSGSRNILVVDIGQAMLDIMDLPGALLLPFSRHPELSAIVLSMWSLGPMDEFMEGVTAIPNPTATEDMALSPSAAACLRAPVARAV